MTNPNKIIKDLKQRNDKLVDQSRMHEIREFSNALKINHMKKSFKDIKKHINIIIGNCAGDQLVLCECNIILKEIEKYEDGGNS